MRNSNNQVSTDPQKSIFWLWAAVALLSLLIIWLSIVIYQESQILKRFSPLIISEESLQTKISKNPAEKNSTTQKAVASEANDSKIPQIVILELKNHEKAHFEKILEASKNQPDAISYANQLGRLDLVSIAIAMFSVVLGVGAVYGFLYIKDVSKIQAREAAEKWLKSPEVNRLIVKTVEEWLDGNKGQETVSSAVKTYLSEPDEEEGISRWQKSLKNLKEFEEDEAKESKIEFE